MAMEMELKSGRAVELIPGTDSLFTGSKRASLLYLPRHSKVAVDTCILLYLAQNEVEQYKELGEKVVLMLQLPLKFVIGQSVFTELHNVMLKASLPLNGLDCTSGNRRHFRLQSIMSLFRELKPFGFAQSERSRDSYLNTVRLTAAFFIQPYDARVIIESVLEGVNVFVSEDMSHGTILECVRDGVKKKVLLWNAFNHDITTYE